MRAEQFNSVPTKRASKAARLFSLPVTSSTIEVFVCRPLNGVRLTRASCAKIAANPPNIGPCASCIVGSSHKRGRVPGTWPDGAAIELTVIRVGTVQVAK